VRVRGSAHEPTNARDLPRLRFGRERRKEEANCESDREPDHPHWAPRLRTAAGESSRPGSLAACRLQRPAVASATRYVPSLLFVFAKRDVINPDSAWSLNDEAEVDIV